MKFDKFSLVEFYTLSYYIAKSFVTFFSALSIVKKSFSLSVYNKF